MKGNSKKRRKKKRRRKSKGGVKKEESEMACVLLGMSEPNLPGGGEREVTSLTETQLKIISQRQNQ